MHRITPCSQKVMLRFRRWSRKEYAAFVSLHRHVTIGQVGRGIADASLGKQKTAVCEGKKTEGMSWTDLSGEDALFGSGGPGLEEVYSRQTGQNCGVCWCRKGKKCLHCF